MHIKFETEFQSKLGLCCQNHVAYRVQKPKKSNMATKQPFIKWGNWKLIGPYSYTQVLSHWSFEFIFKAKLKLESGNQKIQYGCQVAILKVMPLKINRLLFMTTINMHTKFEIEIPKQTWLMPWKPCLLYRWPAGGRPAGLASRTRWIQYTPTPTSLGGGIMRYESSDKSLLV